MEEAQASAEFQEQTPVMPFEEEDVAEDIMDQPMSD